MGEEPKLIRAHIDRQREQLGENLDDLEYRVKQAKDWRVWLSRNPALALGAAFAAGLYVALRGK